MINNFLTFRRVNQLKLGQSVATTCGKMASSNALGKELAEQVKPVLKAKTVALVTIHQAKMMTAGQSMISKLDAEVAALQAQAAAA